MKKLSVVIPAYNAEKTIEECLNSVVAECNSINEDYEIIVVDDGSTDSTYNLLKNYSKKNQNLIIIKQENKGVSAARNAGIKKSSGEFIAFNDSDDKWLHGKLKKQFEYFEKNPYCDLISSQYSNFQRTKIPTKITFKMEVFHNYYVCQSSIMKAKVAKEILFPENMRYSEDMRFFMQVLLKYNCVYLPKSATTSILNKLTFGDIGLSSNLKKMYKGELSNIKFAFINKKISLFTYLVALFYSYLKYLRRCIISKLHKSKNRTNK